MVEGRTKVFSLSPPPIQPSDHAWTCKKLLSVPAALALIALAEAGNDLIGRDQGFFCQVRFFVLCLLHEVRKVQHGSRLKQASALQFNARNNVDFNTWIRDGIPYMSREDSRRVYRVDTTHFSCSEDERRYKKYYGSKNMVDDKAPERSTAALLLCHARFRFQVGLLRLWKALCARQLPFAMNPAFLEFSSLRCRKLGGCALPPGPLLPPGGL